ncbi:MAG: hypothetical protein D6819_01495, partial [Gammaproteobacteria bacterium]
MDLNKPFQFETSACASSMRDAAEGIPALSSRLQTTLEVEGVLRLFFQEVGPRFSLQGLSFKHALEEVDIHIGRRGRHRCSYQLTLNENRLGELICHRGASFTEEELISLERWLCALIYPLRNALLYRKALRRSLQDPLTGVGNR